MVQLLLGQDLQNLDKEMDKFGWTTFDVLEMRLICSLVQTMAQETTTVDTMKMPVLCALTFVSTCIHFKLFQLQNFSGSTACAFHVPSYMHITFLL